jgi:hypothetical protein
MKRFNAILLLAALLAGGSHQAALATTDTDEVEASARFRYETARLTPVEIKLALLDGNPASLSFYSQGENGLRLIETTFTDSLGYYLGELQLPVHLSQVVVIVRAANRQDSLALPISAGAITFAE